MARNEAVIMLTACVNPGGMAFTALQDSDARLKQYKAALEWYLKNTKQKILFVENTGFDISPLFKEYVLQGRLETLTFQGNSYDKSKGKGYGEAIIIEYALNLSKFLNGDVNIIKITGRLICKNVQKMADCYTDRNTVYAMTRLDNRNKFEFISQVFTAPKHFYRDFFIPKKEFINDQSHYWFEHLLYDSTQNWKECGNRFKEMWIPFKLEGVSGSAGTSVNAPYLNNKCSFYIHYLLHRMGYFGPILFWKKSSKNTEKERIDV